jgi:peptidoglycan glycosyltransferase
MNKQIYLVGLAMIAMFVLLFAQLNYLQVFRAGSLNRNPLNTRLALKKFTTKRGDIVTSDGVVVAHSTPTTDGFKWQRTYPEGLLYAGITGYFSFTYGETGAERSFDADLTGSNTAFQLPRSLKDLTVNQDRSQTVTLSVSDRLQRLAAQQLGTRHGAVVALDPTTGAILAMVSTPSFDPNALASHDQQEVRSAWQQLNADPSKPLLPPAYAQRYFPGSTFKVITASAAFDHGADLVTKTFPNLSALPLPLTNGQVLRNFGGEVCGGQLADLFRVSCNTGFAALGLALGGPALAAEAEAFGFNKIPPLDLPGGVPAYFPPGDSFEHDPAGLAKSAIGQENVQAPPLEMALVASAIANGGVIMKPHVLKEVTNSQGQVTRTAQPAPWLTATSPQTAAKVGQLMISVVDNGTGTAAKLPSVQVAGKTGTAQTGQNTIHAWFIAFAPADKPRVAVAVLVENQPESNEATGGAIAGPIAKAVLQAAMQGP